MKPLLVLIYEGFSEIELSFPISMFSIFGGITYDIVGPEEVAYEGWAGAKLVPNKTLKEVDLQQYGGLLLPGISPFKIEEFMADQTILSLIRKVKNNAGLLAGICLTPLAMAHAGVLDNMMITSDAPAETYNEFEGITVAKEHVVWDDQTITAKGPAFVQFTQFIFEAYGFSELAEKMGRFMQDVGQLRLTPGLHLDKEQVI